MASPTTKYVEMATSTTMGLRGNDVKSVQVRISDQPDNHRIINSLVWSLRH
jgi:hypothetical protein